MTEGTGVSETEQTGASTGADTARAPARRRNPIVTALRITVKTLLPIAIIAGGLLGYQHLKNTRPEPRRVEVTEKSFAVETVPVVFEQLQPTLTLYGEAVASRSVDIRALVAGTVVETGAGLKDGGTVDKDDVLLRIDPFDYEGQIVEAKAALQEAKARLVELEASYRQEEDALKRDREQLTIAERDLERADRLSGQGTISARSVDDRKLIVAQRNQAVESRSNNLMVWQARADQQRATIDRLAWSVSQAERRLAETELKAPYAAYVSDVGAEVGRVVSVNDRVATLRDRKQIDVRFSLSDSQYGRVVAAEGDLEGRSVDVIWRVGDTPIRYAARIVRIAATIDTASGGVNVFAALDDPNDPLAIRPGAFVEVQVKDRKYDRVVRLPQTALYAGSTVYIVEGERLAARTVEVVGRADGDALVRGPLQPDERIMSTRLSAPGDGLRVIDRSEAKLSKVANVKS